MKIAIGVRFFGQNLENDLPRIEKFVTAARQIGQTLVAVNTKEDKVGTVGKFPEEAFAVTPWGKFVMPLNAMILKAAEGGAEHLLIASTEFPPTAESVGQLMAHMDNETLVVGAALAEHDYRPGQCVAGDGLTVPWNTFALWNLGSLQNLGFPLIGDAPFNPKMAGVEELTTIALYQELWRSKTLAKLIKVAGVGEKWDMTGWSAERFEKHEAKLRSKKERPAAQMKRLGLPVPLILHI